MGRKPLPTLFYPIEIHMSNKMEHNFLYYLGVAFVSLGIVKLVYAGYLYASKRRKGKHYGKQD